MTLKTLDITDQTLEMINKGINAGFWRHFSEAARDLIKRGLKEGVKSGDFQFLKDEKLDFKEETKKVSM